MNSLRSAASTTIEAATAAYLVGNRERALLSLRVLIRELRTLSATLDESSKLSDAKRISRELSGMSREVDMIAAGVARHIAVLEKTKNG